MEDVLRTDDLIQREFIAIPENENVEEIPEPFAAAPTGVAIAGHTPVELEQVDETPLPAPEPPEQIAPRRDDLLIAATAAVLAASVFLPWYKYGSPPKGVIGWSTGTWAPAIFFLALGSLALIGLRRMRVAVGLPFPETIIHEGVGWICTLAAIVKARFRPAVIGTVHLGVDNKVFIAVGAGLALALLAGRASGKSPFHSLPGWYRGRAGKIGLALIVIVIGAGAAFGTTNSYKSTSLANPGGTTPGTTGRTSPGALVPGTVKGKLPDCAKGFPLPAGVTPDYGYGNAGTSSCVALLRSTDKPAAITEAFKQLFNANHIKFTITQTGNGAVFRMTGPRCGTTQVVSQPRGPTFIALTLTPCKS